MRLTLILFVSFLFNPILDAQTYRKTGASGGTRGIPFEHIMPNNANITSIDVYHGRLVDGFTVYFRDGNGNRGNFHIGGRGGRKSTFQVDYCATLDAIYVRTGDYVDSIRFRFSDGTLSETYGGPGGEPNVHEVPVGARGIGFYGRSGRVIDKIGIVYRQ